MLITILLLLACRLRRAMVNILVTITWYMAFEMRFITFLHLLVGQKVTNSFIHSFDKTISHRQQTTGRLLQKATILLEITMLLKMLRPSLAVTFHYTLEFPLLTSGQIPYILHNFLGAVDCKGHASQSLIVKN